MVYRPEWYQNKNTVKYVPYWNKKGKILVIDIRIVHKNDTSSTLILLPLSPTILHESSMLHVAIKINNWVIFVPKSM